MRNHPDRIGLHNEVHARPRPATPGPHRVSHLALLRDRASPQLPAPLVALCTDHSLPPPAPGQSHYFGDFARFRLKWERHGEFDDFTIYAQGVDPQAPFAAPALDLLPRGFTEALPGELIAAVHVSVVPVTASTPLSSGPEEAARHFDTGTVVGSFVGENAAVALTDLRLAPDGFSRFILYTQSLTDNQTGREVQRLIEIEVYRLMAMLAFPVARAAASELDAVERALSDLVARLESASLQDEPELLREITHQAAVLERLSGETSFRFDAARAYHALVRQRLGELREARLEGVLTLSGFLDRRFSPAMAFCQTVSARVEATARRVERASGLLRTRVDIERESQNQEMLAAMNRRAQLQLRLQQTVEGLSVAAITYYAVGLVGYVFKGLKGLGLGVDPDVASGLAVIPVALLIAWSVHHIRRNVVARLRSEPPGQHE